MLRRTVIAIAGVALVAGAVFLFRTKFEPHPENQKAGKFPEELVFVRSSDDVVSAGAMFAPPRASSRSVAIVWIHGWGANFYLPSYVGIGRALAARGYPTITANTRMHDIGNVARYNGEKRVRGGGYWGVTREDARDISAWINFAEHGGFQKIVLVGHSAGWASVGRYQADTRDERVVGLVFASGAVGLPGAGDDAQLVAQATKLVADGAGEDLLRLPNRSFPSFVSAATFLDTVNTPREYKDFFGTQIANPAVMRVRCPILAFFGSSGDIGGEPELRLLKSSVQRLSAGPSRVDISMIQSAGHEYVGQEDQVAQTIALWAATLAPAEPGVKKSP